MPSTTPKPAKVEPPTEPGPESIQYESRTSATEPSVHQAVYYDPSKISQNIVSRVAAPETEQTPPTAQPPCFETLPKLSCRMYLTLNLLSEEQATPESFVFNPAMADLRKCGYVMWDSSRLDEWGVLSEPLDYLPNDGQVQRYALEQKSLDKRRAWKKEFWGLHEKLTKTAVARQVLPKMRYTGEKFLAARRMIRSSKAWAIRLGVEMDMPPGSFDLPLEEEAQSLLNQLMGCNVMRYP
ncbi:uncharacterized protein N7503_004107 [Penicillium pulvis]|uniref:uncharacterized protein n=1 Tax=Penicillium pulvis TaxID=1562058 RepID=UPI002548A837|nr:uncharacterized protein N7503_004107 [Penicillium pulvis]KAJ5806505.1 hypothetical protein N7503_004107 [Penicillium pulvis]